MQNNQLNAGESAQNHNQRSKTLLFCTVTACSSSSSSGHPHLSAGTLLLFLFSAGLQQRTGSLPWRKTHVNTQTWTPENGAAGDKEPDCLMETDVRCGWTLTLFSCPSQKTQVCSKTAIQLWIQKWCSQTRNPRYDASWRRNTQTIQITRRVQITN